MTDKFDYTVTAQGMYGTSEFVPYPPREEAETKVGSASIDLGRGTWLITSPGWHPLWSQYVMSIVSLEDHPDMAPAVIRTPDATHELMIVAINPDHRLNVVKVQQFCRNGKLPFLTPVNHANQFKCTDDEIRELAWLVGNGIVNGQLNPETADAPERIREDMLAACLKTLAHIRGEAHSSL